MTATDDSANLDLLRSYAVLAVVASHLFAYMGGPPQLAVFAHNFGVGGVCFFFVHTCLVLLRSLERTPGKRLAVRFYIRRAFRIYPLCWLCIGVAVLTGWTDVPAAKMAALGWRGFAVNLALVQNFSPFPSVIGPLWSLPWEVQMYLLLPVLFLLLRKRRFAPRWALALWAAAMALALVVTVLHTPRTVHAAVYPPLFLGGLAAFCVERRVLPRLPALMWAAAVPGLLLARCLLLTGDAIDTPRNVLVNGSTCLLLGLAIPYFRQMRLPALAVGARLLARYSYGVYLFHLPALIAVSRGMGTQPAAWRMAVFAVATAAASVAGFHLVEDPFIRLGKRLAQGLDARTSSAVST